MKKELAEAVYLTLQGRLSMPVPGVKSAFEEDSVCDICYQDMLNAYDRLRERLGVVNEDRDVETIINAFMRITDELCMEMFAYGEMFADQE